MELPSVTGSLIGELQARSRARFCMFVFRYSIYDLEFDNCMTNDFVQNAEITKQI